MRDAAINLRALPEQRDLIDHAASLLGKHRSEFMLDAPPAPNPGLERLMAVKAPWRTQSERSCCSVLRSRSPLPIASTTLAAGNPVSMIGSSAERWPTKSVVPVAASWSPMQSAVFTVITR